MYDVAQGEENAYDGAQINGIYRYPVIGRPDF